MIALEQLIDKKRGGGRAGARLRKKQQGFVAFEKGMQRWLDRSGSEKE